MLQSTSVLLTSYSNFGVANAPYHDQQEEAIDFVMAMACVENGCKLKDINRSEVEEGMYLAFGKR